MKNDGNTNIGTVILIIFLLFFCPMIVLIGIGVYFIVPIIIIGIICFIYFIYVQPASDANKAKGDPNSLVNTYNKPTKVRVNNSLAFVYRGTVSPFRNTVTSSRSVSKGTELNIVKVVRSVGTDYGILDTGESILMSNVTKIE